MTEIDWDSFDEGDTVRITFEGTFTRDVPSDSNFAVRVSNFAVKLGGGSALYERYALKAAKDVRLVKSAEKTFDVGDIVVPKISPDTKGVLILKNGWVDLNTNVFSEYGVGIFDYVTDPEYFTTKNYRLKD